MGGKPRKKATPYGLPSRVIIKSQAWDIVYMDHVQKDDWLLGACEAHNRLIYIDKTQSRESMVDTLLHEIFHAYVAMSELEPDEPTEESFVCLATGAMIDMIRSFPGSFLDALKSVSENEDRVHNLITGKTRKMTEKTRKHVSRSCIR